MEVKTDVDPVGNEIQDGALEVFIQNMKKTWDETHETARWWQFWKRVNFKAVTNFLLKCLDDLVAYMIEKNIPGADKKATVLVTLEKIYDYAIAGLLPIYLRPFATPIKSFIFNVVLSASIDWIVEKYKNGNWRPKPVEEVVAQWYSLHAQLFGVPGDHRPKV